MKSIYLGFILLLTAFVSYSQNSEFQPEWAFGANGGITLSKMRLYPEVPQDLLMQGSGGITVRYLSEKHFGIQCELNYSMRGWTEQTDTVTHFNEYARSLAYLELPLMTHVYFDLGKRARLVFNIGPQVAYHLNEKTLKKEIKAEFGDYPEYYNRKVQQKFEYGIGGGAGFEVRTGIGSFILEGRYYFGLSDIFKSSRADLQSSAHQVIGIKLTYLYH
jgi:hypothetical protein